MDPLKQDAALREDLGMLSVMETLAESERITQRELSHATGLNLKKVNYCLHKLLEKGHVKFHRVIHNPDKRGYLYVLTPAGFKEKSKLTYRFLKFSLSFYNCVEDKFTHCLSEIEQAGVRRIVLYGASNAVRVVTDLVKGKGLAVMGVLDERCLDDEYEGMRVWKNVRAIDVDWDGLLVTDLAEWDEVERRLGKLALPEKKIWRLS